MADRTVSSGFAPIHFSELQWPAHMLDGEVYQPALECVYESQFDDLAGGGL